MAKVKTELQASGNETTLLDALQQVRADMEKVREALNVGVEDLENPPSFDDMRKSITKALQLLAAEQESAAPKLLT